MNVLKYNNHQLAMFDFEKARASRQDFLNHLKLTLGIKQEQSTKKMLETCCANPSVLTQDQRHFVYDIAVRFFDNKELSEKQTRYLSSLARRCLI